MSRHEHLKAFHIYFLPYQENSHLESSVPKYFPQSNSLWWILPWKILSQKIPSWNIPIHVSKYYHQVNFFFNYCYRYHWYYYRCFKNAEVFTFVKVCQNEVLSEERQIMKWVTAFQVRIFWVEIFREEISRRKFDG